MKKDQITGYSLIKKFKDSSVDQEVIDFIEQDDELKTELVKAYILHRPSIKNLPLDKQLRICMNTVSFAAQTLQQYQTHIKEFTENLKKEPVT